LAIALRRQEKIHRLASLGDSPIQILPFPVDLLIPLVHPPTGADRTPAPETQPAIVISDASIAILDWK
jgi:hypothetical protein